MGMYRKFTPEYREEAVKMVIESGRPIAAVARDLGLNEGTLGNWVTKYRDEHPASEELDIAERARLKELEKENRELRMERDFLKKPRPSSRRNNEREILTHCRGSWPIRPAPIRWSRC